MLELRDIVKSYNYEPLLSGVFEVREHEILALLGSSGSGKSTLLRIIAVLGMSRKVGMCFGMAEDITEVPLVAPVQPHVSGLRPFSAPHSGKECRFRAAYAGTFQSRHCPQSK